MFRQTTLLYTFLACVAITGPLSAAMPEIRYQPLAPGTEHVPRTLLPLIHAAEVQKELGLTGPKLAEFLVDLREIDAVWWPARILPPEKNAKIVADLEKRLIASLRDVVGDSAALRLRQLELQAQGIRALIRPEVAEFLELTPGETERLSDAFVKTDEAAAAIGPGEESTQGLRAVRKAERSMANRILTSRQKQRLVAALGGPLDTSALGRIYPLAPELVDSGHWTTDEPVTLEGLRGRVVILHFYAFQCHNCHANFPHYKRWHDSLAEKGVTVIGIQTPETAAESDVQKVKQAARERGFEFPVLIDIDNTNWDAWGNTMWPTVYVIDKQGYIRGWWQGELNWKGATGDKSIETLVDRLVKE